MEYCGEQEQDLLSEQSTVDSKREGDKLNYRFTLLEDVSYEQNSSSSEQSIRPKWRRTPRSPSDFSSIKFSESTLSDADYEEWCLNYYEELRMEEKRRRHTERQTDTFELDSDKSEEVLRSFFQEKKTDKFFFRSKYWGPQNVRRHWPLRMKKKEYFYFPAVHPHLNLRSRYGRYHSLLNSAEAVPETTFKKTTCTVVKKVIENIESTEPQLLKILVCDNLFNLKWFDSITKVTVLRCICRFLRTQTKLERVYIENTKLKRMEGIILLCALSKNAGDRLEELHIWNLFGFAENPVLLGNLAKRGRNYSVPGSKNLIQLHYLQILCYFTNLTHLSINYAYLANKKGDVLLYLKSVVYGRLKELRLLCVESERPLLTSPCQGIGGYNIKDGVWKRVAELCPDLRVKLVFLNMPQYENIITFLSKSIPVSYIYISSGIDLQFNVPWDIDSTLLCARNWYASTLETLSLHLWHHRDLLDFIIKCKILDEFPNLTTFEFIGILEDVQTLDSFLNQLCTGDYKLKSLLFWLEVTYTNRNKRKATAKAITDIREKYKPKFHSFDIDIDIQLYSI